MATRTPFECGNCGSTDKPEHVRFEYGGDLEVVKCSACGEWDGWVTLQCEEEIERMERMDAAGLFDCGDEDDEEHAA